MILPLAPRDADRSRRNRAPAELPVLSGGPVRPDRVAPGRRGIVAAQGRNAAHAISRRYRVCRGDGKQPAPAISGPLRLWCSTQGLIALAMGKRHAGQPAIEPAM